MTTTAVVSEGQYQLEKFGYDPYTKGKAYKTKQVTDFIEQPWYSQLMESGGIQVHAHLCRTFIHAVTDVVPYLGVGSKNGQFARAGNNDYHCCCVSSPLWHTAHGISAVLAARTRTEATHKLFGACMPILSGSCDCTVRCRSTGGAQEAFCAVLAKCPSSHACSAVHI